MASQVMYGYGKSAPSAESKNSTAFVPTDYGKGWEHEGPNPTAPVDGSALATTIDTQTRTKVEPSYYMEYDNISNDLKKLHKTLGILDGNGEETFRTLIKSYNRFKMPTLNDAFQRGYAHVFFTRPDCNIIDGGKLTSRFADNKLYTYIFSQSPDLVKQLCLNNGQDHDYMLYISNKAASFSLNDEYINIDTYGKTYAGWKIAYGKGDVESRTAGDFSITYNDDRMLHIYQLHKMWVDYISGCFYGRYAPNPKYILDRILDYASACYFILTAEDGETIVFWSKYYGVFPTTIPSNQYSWAYGNVIQNPQIDIKYAYSFKEDYNPNALFELNLNSRLYDGVNPYEATYDKNLGHVGTTWVGAPFVEICTGSSDYPYLLKLRFKQK